MSHGALLSTLLLLASARVSVPQSNLGCTNNVTDGKACIDRLGEGRGGKRLTTYDRKCRKIVLEYYAMQFELFHFFFWFCFVVAVSYINDTSSCSCNLGEWELLSATLPHNIVTCILVLMYTPVLCVDVSVYRPGFMCACLSNFSVAPVNFRLDNIICWERGVLKLYLHSRSVRWQWCDAT